MWEWRNHNLLKPILRVKDRGRYKHQDQFSCGTLPKCSLCCLSFWLWLAFSRSMYHQRPSFSLYKEKWLTHIDTHIQIVKHMHILSRPLNFGVSKNEFSYTNEGQSHSPPTCIHVSSDLTHEYRKLLAHRRRRQKQCQCPTTPFFFHLKPWAVLETKFFVNVEIAGLHRSYGEKTAWRCKAPEENSSRGAR